MTLPMQTWMSDRNLPPEAHDQLYPGSAEKGQAEGILNPQVRAGILLDFMLGTSSGLFSCGSPAGSRKAWPASPGSFRYGLAGHCPSVGHPVTSDTGSPQSVRIPHDADRSRQGHGDNRIGLNTKKECIMAEHPELKQWQELAEKQMKGKSVDASCGHPGGHSRQTAVYTPKILRGPGPS
jgi:hypothetical protein